MGKKSDNNYKEAYKKIKPFIDFKIDLRKKLTRTDKWYISRYFNLLQDLHAVTRKNNKIELTPMRRYSPDKKNLKAVKKLYGIKGARLKAIPIPTKLNPGNGRITPTKDGLLIKSKALTKRLVLLDQDDLEYAYENDVMEQFLRSKLKKYKLNKTGFYTIKVGRYELGRGSNSARFGSIEALAIKLMELFTRIKNKYDKEKQLVMTEIIDGVYINNFNNQRKPTSKENKKLNGLVKGKKKNRRNRL